MLRLPTLDSRVEVKTKEFLERQDVEGCGVGFVGELKALGNDQVDARNPHRLQIVFPDLLVDGCEEESQTSRSFRDDLASPLTQGHTGRNLRMRYSGSEQAQCDVRTGIAHS